MNKLFTLTHPQKRIWYIEKIYQGSSMYNIGGTVKIQGMADLSALEKAINLFIQSNDAIRLKIHVQDGNPYQYVEDYQYVQMRTQNFDTLDEFYKWEQAEMRVPILLEDHVLFHFELYHVKDQVSGYLVKMHHIICDGWTIGLLGNQVCQAYESIVKGNEYVMEAPKPYLHYLDEEANYIASDRFLKNKKFWMEMYGDLETLTFKGTSDEINGCRRTYEIPSDLTEEIKEWVSENSFSMNSFFVGLYFIYFYKVSGEKDTVLGLPIMNRMNHKWKQVTGMLTSMMPFRYQLNPQMTVLEIIKEVGSKVKKCLFNQKYPYNILVQDLELKKKKISNLYDVCINYYNTKPPTSFLGMSTENREVYNGAQVYSLQMIIRDWTDRGNITIDIDYKISDYSAEEIDDMFQAVTHLARQIVENGRQTVDKISVFQEGDLKEMLYGYNQTDCEYPRNKSIIQLFEEQVDKTPNKIAISCGSESLTYREFNQKVNQLARTLQDMGWEKIVAVYTKRSIETVIGIYAVLKTAAAYMPIDASTPVNRILYMLNNANVKCVLTNINTDFIDDKDVKVFDLNKFSLYTKENENLEVASRPSDLAYIVYTSGSTGEPKGVMIENQGLVNYIWWAKKQYVKSLDDIMPLYSSLSFDLTVTTLFMPLISGIEMRVYKEDDKEFVLYTILKENKATIIKLTPAHLSLIKEMDFSRSVVNTMIVGGEDLRTSLARHIYEAYNHKIRIFNEYGPTETVVGCMIYLYNPEDQGKSVPIGVPTDNVQIYLLNDQLEPVPRGSMGEIFISGDGIARGYINQEDLNQEKFLNNPFIKGKRMYRTGDLARFQGTVLEYLGRFDSQVKIHGYRIELGEIEKQLLSIDGIKEAVVCDFDNQEQEKVLYAYLLLDKMIERNEIKDKLMKMLPTYMIPQYITILDELPLTHNGKVDRKQLLMSTDLSTETEEEMEEPEKGEEQVLLSEVLSVLSLQKASMGANFFQIGGDSIKAILISSKLRQRGYELEVRNMMLHPVLKEMVLYMKKVQNKETLKENCSGRIKNTPIFEWFLQQNFNKPSIYTQACLLEIVGKIEVELINEVLDQLVEIHDVFRINYFADEKQFFYNEQLKDVKFHIKEYDLSALSFEMQQKKMDQIKEQLDRELSITDGILLKACLFKKDESHKQLLLVIHHLAVDGISWRILLDDLEWLLKHKDEKEVVHSLYEKCSYGMWAEKLIQYEAAISKEELDYWKQQDSIEDGFPIGKNMTDETSCVRKTASFTLSKEYTKAILTNCNVPYLTETKDLLIIALMQTMKHYVETKEIVIELEHHGRVKIADKIDLSRTIGWFTTLYPFVCKLEAEDTDTQIKQIKEGIRKIPNNGIGYGIKKYLTKELQLSSNKHIRFNYLGEFKKESKESKINLVNQYALGSDVQNDLTCLLEINCYVLDECLYVDTVFDENMYDEEFVHIFMERFQHNIIALIQYLTNKDDIEFTPSDFELDDFTQEDLDMLFSRGGDMNE